jgi:2-polyprenyl-6-methoxyphenol hydroxylase-like FAD-dependent oxidoreductase
MIRIEDALGNILSTFDYTKLDVPLNRAMVVLRYTLHEMLLEAARAEGVDVRFSHRCVSATENDSGVGIAFERGDDDRFDTVLACDGINSPVRESLGLRTKRRVIGEAYLRGVAPVPIAESTIRELWGTRGRRFGICPLAGGEVYFFCNAPLGKWKEMLGRGVSGFVESWADFNAEAHAILRAVTDWDRVNYSELHEIVLDRWHVGRVFLVGDAAHAMTPNLGQGANSSMVDALVLVHLIARAIRAGEPLAGVGPKYERIRKRFVTRIQDTARQVGLIAAWSSFFSRSVRNNVLSVFDRFDALSRPGMLLGAGFNPSEQEFFSSL